MSTCTLALQALHRCLALLALPLSGLWETATTWTMKLRYVSRCPLVGAVERSGDHSFVMNQRTLSFICLQDHDYMSDKLLSSLMCSCLMDLTTCLVS